MSQLVVLILAAGEGKRMRSELPKVLHVCGEKPMLVRVIESARGLNPDKIVVVTGRHHKQIIQTIGKWMDSFGIVFVEQPEPIGTGHAVRCCESEFKKNDRVLILNGDMPLIQTSLLQKVLSNTVDSEGVILTAMLENPYGYGRIVYDASGEFVAIVEEKDCTEEERGIREINTGVYVFLGKVLHSFLPKIKNTNKQKEYYLTDIVGIAKKSGGSLKTFLLEENENVQIRGANTPEELKELEGFLRV